MSLNKFLIVDNFYECPNDIRNQALNANFLHSINKTQENYIQSEWPGLSTDAIYTPKYLDVTVSKILKKPVRLLYPGLFRKAIQGDNSSMFCHTDYLSFLNKQKMYTGIVYLTLNKFCKNKIGTKFYKHKITGLEQITDLQTYNSTLLDCKKRESWELTDSIDMKYNRLLLLDGTYFHSPGDSFGDNKYNAVYKQIFTFIEI